MPTLLCALAVIAVHAVATSSPAIPYRLNTQPPLLVVVIAVDALRADRLSVYGFPSRQPGVDALAEAASVFEDAYTNASWTKPAVSALFTGLWPTEVGTTTMLEDARGEPRETRLAASVPTLAEVMRERGYAAGAFVNNPHISPELGFDRGFDTYEDSVLACSEIADRFLTWRGGLPAGRKAFAYMHLLEPHAPYEAPASASPDEEASYARLSKVVTEAADYGSFSKWRDDVNGGRAGLTAEDLRVILGLYDGEVTRTDSTIGGLVASLKSSGEFSEALIVLMADHGENFLEQGVIAHPATTLFEAQMRIPLLIKFPESWGIAPGRVKGRVQTLDVTATLAQACGGDLGRGRSLTAYAAFGRVPDGPIVCEAVRAAALYDGHMKAVFRMNGGKVSPHEIYDLSSDLPARRNLLSTKPSYASRVRKRMERWLEFVDSRGEANHTAGHAPDDERLRQLRALGYLN